MPRMSDASDVLEEKSICVAFDDQPPELLDQGAPIVRTHRQWLHRTLRVLARSSRASEGSLLPFIHPVGGLRERLTRRAADDDYSVGGLQPSGLAQLLAGQTPDVALPYFAVKLGVRPQRSTRPSVVVHGEPDVATGHGRADSETAGSCEQVDYWHFGARDMIDHRLADVTGGTGRLRAHPSNRPDGHEIRPARAHVVDRSS